MSKQLVWCSESLSLHKKQSLLNIQIGCHHQHIVYLRADFDVQLTNLLWMNVQEQ